MIQDRQAVFVEELDQAVAAIFEAMLGMAVAPLPVDWSPSPDRLAATVHVTGGWSAVIVFEVGPAMACRLAGRFLSMDTPEAIDNDVRDVLGELANMIGGNLKSAVAPDATLSIPDVVDGADFTLRICGGGEVSRQAFMCDDGEFWVSLIQSRQSKGNHHECPDCR